MTIKLHDIDHTQIRTAVQNHTKQIGNVVEALDNNPIPDELLHALRAGIKPAKGHGLG